MSSLQRSLTLILTPLLGVIFLLSAFGAGQGQDAPLDGDATASIAGIVTDPSGHPLPGIIVTVNRDQYGWFVVKTVKTDTAGAYKINYLNTGLYRLGFSSPTEQYSPLFYPDSQTLEDAQEIPVAGVDMSGLQTALSPAAQIAGVITMWDGARPSYAYVTAYTQADGVWKSAKSGLVSADGSSPMSYRIIGLSPGNYRVGVIGLVDESYFTNRYQEFYDNAVAVEDARDLFLSAGTIVSDVNFVLGENPNLSDLSGAVTTPEGVGIPGIEVTAFISGTWNWQDVNQTRTITDGVFMIRSLPAGTYALRYRDPQQRYVTEFHHDAPTLQAATPLSLTAGADFTNLDAQLTRTGAIYAEIVMHDGQPPGSVTMNAYSAASGYTQLVASRYAYDNNGQVITMTLGGLPPDNYRLYVGGSYDGNTYSEYYDDALLLQNANDVTVMSAATTTISVTLGDNPGYGQISGVVRSRQSVPLAGIRVTAHYQPYLGQDYWSSQQSTFTDQLGRYRLWALTPNSYTIRFEDNAGTHYPQFYADATSQEEATQLRVESGQVTTGIDAALDQTGVITGLLTLYDGRPATGASLTLIKQANDEWVFVSSRYLDSGSASPYYQFTGLTTGVYRLSASAWFDGEGYYPTIYYGGADTIETAQDIAVVDGYTTAHINFVFGEDRYDARLGGTVYSSGAPLPDMRVDIYYDESGYGNWQRLVYVNTDTAGAFRVGGLRAGQYRICVVDRAQVHATVCYPGAKVVEGAATLFLADGQALDSLSIEMTDFEHQAYLPLVGR